MSKINSLFFYLGVFFVVILLSAIYDLLKNKEKKKSADLILFCAFSIIAIISGIRYNVGSDYNAYIKMYESYNYLEIGSRALFNISNKISTNAQTIIIIYAILTNFFIMLAVREVKTKGKTSLIVATYLFLFFPFSLNIIRQSLAIAILLLAFLKLINNKKKTSLVLGILAFTIHNSSLFFIPYFFIFSFIKKEKINKITINYTYALLFSFLVYITLFGNNYTSLKYFGYLGSFSIKRIDYYQLLSYIPFLIVCTISRDIYKKSEILSILNSLFISGVLLEVVLSSTQVSRIGLYLSIYSIILIPSLLEEIRNIKTRRLIKYMYITFLVGYFIGVFYLHGRTNIFPYSTIFTREIIY